MSWPGGSAYFLSIWNLACSRPQHPRPFDEPGILLSWPFTLPQGSDSRHRSCHPPCRRKHGEFGTSFHGVAVPFSVPFSKSRLPGIRSKARPANGRLTRHEPACYPKAARPSRRLALLPPPHLPNSRRIGRCVCGGGGSRVSQTLATCSCGVPRGFPRTFPLAWGSTRPLVHPDRSWPRPGHSQDARSAPPVTRRWPALPRYPAFRTDLLRGARCSSG